MWLRKLADWAASTAAPPPIGLELRPDRFALLHVDRPAAGPPHILGHARHRLPSSDPGAAAAVLHDAWARLALPNHRVVVSLPSPPARFTLLPTAAWMKSGAAAIWPDITAGQWTCVARLLPGQPARVLVGAVPNEALESALTLLDLAGLAAAQVQIDVLALLTAYRHTPAWTGDTPLARLLIHADDDGYRWYRLSPTDGLPEATGEATHETGGFAALADQHPERVFLAGPAARVRTLLTDLQATLQDVRFCSNPFAGLPLTHDQDRRSLTAQAPELSVALGLALGAHR
ncbi:MAG: hypothetical protein JO171_05965 [Paludibacterium sp.]|uniref:hypothetical protein n=1 Tax=Paludibacterium sp. TaxID=1917523 RepID=UPI0025E759E9|nr:hypothetical protein [Paludibacterium sp.]MBV8046676.1 hypothetical protein [Paludibacterium sp.]MBV8649587.1 hypothetical protein [Paludibacterium sp.]